MRKRQPRHNQNPLISLLHIHKILLILGQGKNFTVIVRARAIVHNENKKETGWVEKSKTEESFVQRLHESWNLVVQMLFHVLGAHFGEYK